MKNLLIYFVFIFSVVLLFGFAYSFGADEPDGKKIFVEKKCISCHSVESAGIESKKKNADDLSKVGDSKKADFLEKYLTKKEKINDKEHKTAFKGTEEELKAISKWLGSLKSAK
jgi:mono/diheme cytochrome c family protein